MSNLVLAMDFGTTNSVAGVVSAGRVQAPLPIDPFALVPTLMRTLVYFESEKKAVFGEEALLKFIENEMEGRIFRSFKSQLSNAEFPGTQIGGRFVSIEDLVGAFMGEVRRRCENLCQGAIKSAVIGRPARYSMNSEKDALALDRMKRASKIAGFETVEFVPEPLAAAFDFHKQISKEQIALVGDFGGGTSDFTIYRLRPKSFSSEDVLAIDGFPKAGDVLDSYFMSQRLNKWFGAATRYRLPMSSNTLQMPPGILEKLNRPSHIVHLKEKATYEYIKMVQKCALSAKERENLDRLFALVDDQQIFSLFELIEKSKRELTAKDLSQLIFDYPGIELNESFERNEFEKWSQGFIDDIVSAVERCLKSANLEKEKIDLIYLTGGTAQVPFVKQWFVNQFGKDRLQEGDLFHSVLSGLAAFAAKSFVSN